MLKKTLFFTFNFLILFCPSCKTDTKYPYAIRDFKSILRPYLTKSVWDNIVGFSHANQFVENSTTDEELRKLSLSEHPVLRTLAFRGMLTRKTFDHFHVLMAHLDDTAMINYDKGE